MWDYLIPLVVCLTLGVTFGGLGMTVVDIAGDWVRTRLALRQAHQRLWELEHQVRTIERDQATK